MKLNDILSAYHTDPAKNKKYAKEICSNLRGTVKPNITSKLSILLVTGAVVLWSIQFCSEHSGVLSMLFMIVATMGMVVLNMYMFSWELTFDGSTGFFNFHTMFGGTIRFHVSEIEAVQNYTSSYRGKRTDYLTLVVNQKKIPVALRSYYVRPSQNENNYTGGYDDAEKLEQYLGLYRQFLASDSYGIAQNDGLSPAVRAAIAQQQNGYIPKRVEPVTEMPSIPEMPSLETAVNLQKESAPPEKTVPIPEKISLQKETESNFPDPAKPQNSAFPDPAMSRKEVNADALFNDVLGQFGKAPSPPPSGKSKKEADVDALFDNVLKQFGKK